MTEIIELILSLSQEIKTIKAYLQQYQKTRIERFNEAWIDGQDVMQSLHISKRTLQTLRDNGTLPYSRVNGKFYYKVSDIEKMLEANYQPSKSAGHGDK
jgi:hypothetical protein